MILVVKRELLCPHTSAASCERCFGIVIENPQGVERNCVISSEDDGSDILTLIIKSLGTDDQTFYLDKAEQEVLIASGWLSLLEHPSEAI